MTCRGTGAGRASRFPLDGEFRVSDAAGLTSAKA